MGQFNRYTAGRRGPTVLCMDRMDCCSRPCRDRGKRACGVEMDDHRSICLRRALSTRAQTSLLRCLSQEFGDQPGARCVPTSESPGLLSRRVSRPIRAWTASLGPALSVSAGTLEAHLFLDGCNLRADATSGRPPRKAASKNNDFRVPRAGQDVCGVPPCRAWSPHGAPQSCSTASSRNRMRP